MQLYLVQYSDYDHHHVVGVFSTIERAEEAKARYEKFLSDRAEEQIQELYGGQDEVYENTEEFLRSKCQCDDILRIELDEMEYPFVYKDENSLSVDRKEKIG